MSDDFFSITTTVTLHHGPVEPTLEQIEGLIRRAKEYGALTSYSSLNRNGDVTSVTFTTSPRGPDEDQFEVGDFVKIKDCCRDALAASWKQKKLMVKDVFSDGHKTFLVLTRAEGDAPEAWRVRRNFDASDVEHWRDEDEDVPCKFEVGDFVKLKDTFTGIPISWKHKKLIVKGCFAGDLRPEFKLTLTPADAEVGTELSFDESDLERWLPRFDVHDFVKVKGEDVKLRVIAVSRYTDGLDSIMAVDADAPFEARLSKERRWSFRSDELEPWDGE